MRLFVFVVIFVAGCHSEPRPPSTPESLATSTSETMDGMSEGAGCGGVKALPCAPGLACVTPARAVAGQGGICTSEPGK